MNAFISRTAALAAAFATLSLAPSAAGQPDRSPYRFVTPRLDFMPTPDLPFAGRWVVADGTASPILEIAGDGSVTLTTVWSDKKTTTTQGRFRSGTLTIATGLDEPTTYALKIREGKLVLTGGRLKAAQEYLFARAPAAPPPDQPDVATKAFEQPTLPKGYGEITCDYSGLKDHYDFIDVGVNEKSNCLVFTLKAKKDRTEEPDFNAFFYDADGVKTYFVLVSVRPFKAFKKGDVVYATVNLTFIPVNKDVWGKATKMKFTVE